MSPDNLRSKRFKPGDNRCKVVIARAPFCCKYFSIVTRYYTSLQYFTFTTDQVLRRVQWWNRMEERKGVKILTTWGRSWLNWFLTAFKILCEYIWQPTNVCDRQIYLLNHLWLNFFFSLLSLETSLAPLIVSWLRIMFVILQKWLNVDQGKQI